MTLQRLFISLLASLSFAACHAEGGPARRIEIDGAASFSEADAKVITDRLRAATAGGLFSRDPTYKLAVKGQVLTVHASAAPADAQARYLLSHQGKFEVASEAGVLWFDQGHVADAVAGFDGQQRPVLNLRLNQDGSTRLARLSSTGVATVVLARLDGQTLVAARLTAPITDGRLQMTVAKPLEEVRLMVELLKSGPLSFVPGAVRIQAE